MVVLQDNTHMHLVPFMRSWLALEGNLVEDEILGQVIRQFGPNNVGDLGANDRGRE